MERARAIVLAAGFTLMDRWSSVKASEYCYGPTCTDVGFGYACCTGPESWEELTWDCYSPYPGIYVPTNVRDYGPGSCSGELPARK